MSSELPQIDPDRPVACITGGSSGIGLATAIRLARRGYHLALCGRDPTRLAQALRTIAQNSGPQEAAIEAMLSDLAAPEEITTWADRVIERFGRVDVLVNNAARATLHEMSDISDPDFEELVDTNIRGPFYLTQRLWAQMRQSGGGAIVNISSLAAIDPFPGFSLYGASKAWVETLSRALAQEGGPLGIRVYCIRPGAVETPMLRGLFPDFPTEQCVSADDVAAVIERCIIARDTDNPPVGVPIAVTNQQEPT